MGLADPSLCGNVSTAVQPAAFYELLANIVLLALLFFLSRRLRRPGALILIYLFGYVITQFLLFFVRDNLIVNFLGLDWGLKQAQWTSLVVFILLIPITYLVLRFSKPVPVGEVAATYGILQKPKPGPKAEAAAEKERAKGEEEQPDIEAEDDVQNGKPEAEEPEVRIESKSSD